LGIKIKSLCIDYLAKMPANRFRSFINWFENCIGGTLRKAKIIQEKAFFLFKNLFKFGLNKIELIRICLQIRSQLKFEVFSN